MNTSPLVPNFLTVDVEEYFHVNYSGWDASTVVDEPSNVESQVELLISIFASAALRCTFFVLGEVAAKYRAAIRQIDAAGHEIASHSYTHESVHSMTPHQFRAQLERSCGLLEDLTGKKVLGYRAPSFSVNADTVPWFYPTLEQCGLAYSSSIVPGRTFLYGIPDFPAGPHRPKIGERTTGIVEFPITTFGLLGTHLPLYVRLLTAGALERHLHRANRSGYPGILYVHPREIDPSQPRIPLSRMQSIIHYWGIRGCEAKLRKLTHANLRFTTIADYLNTRPI